MSTPPVGVAHFGLGPVGLAAASIVTSRPRLESVVALDVDPELRGKDLGQLVGRDAMDVKVDAEDDADFSGARVALHCTGSSLADVAPQLLRLIDRGLSVVSSCEELSYPWAEHGAVARRLDRAAKGAGVAVVGTGVNPGFAMDYLPLTLSAVTDKVKSVRVHRVQDVRDRRLPLQRKVGVGLAAEQFARLAERHEIGHVGLRQSARALVAGMGWEEPRLEERLAPILADRPLACGLGPIEPGRVAGIDHTVVAVVDGREVVGLRLEMAVGLPEPRDEVSIDAYPPVRMTVRGGFRGDPATAAILVNAVEPAIDAAPGLRVMSDLPPPRSVPGGTR
jgi:2,4-diaminopentanoate dehydrogenase